MKPVLIGFVFSFFAILMLCGTFAGGFFAGGAAAKAAIEPQVEELNNITDELLAVHQARYDLLYQKCVAARCVNP